MERVFPTNVSPAFYGRGIEKSGEVFVRHKVGTIDSVLEPGRFIVKSLTGETFEAKGRVSLTAGTKVSFLLPFDHSVKYESSIERKTVETLSDGGAFWKVFIPLGFGGEVAKAKLEVFVGAKDQKSLGKNSPAIYFVFTVMTNVLGEIQWSVYLKEHQLSLQVYSAGGKKMADQLKTLIQAVEKSLKSKGFYILAPTIVLSKSFKVPAGFRLNVSG
jgi:hypothetical protein